MGRVARGPLHRRGAGQRAPAPDVLQRPVRDQRRRRVGDDLRSLGRVSGVRHRRPADVGLVRRRRAGPGGARRSTAPPPRRSGTCSWTKASPRISRRAGRRALLAQRLRVMPDKRQVKLRWKQLCADNTLPRMSPEHHRARSRARLRGVQEERICRRRPRRPRGSSYRASDLRGALDVNQTWENMWFAILEPDFQGEHALTPLDHRDPQGLAGVPRCRGDLVRLASHPGRGRRRVVRPARERIPFPSGPRPCFMPGGPPRARPPDPEEIRDAMWKETG